MCRYFHKIFLVVLMLVISQAAYAQSKQVKLSSLNWEPYIGKSLPGYGYVYELVDAAFKKSGYDIKVLFVPWARALLMAQRGDVDAVFPEYYSKERSDEFAFSKPFLGGPVGFYKRKDNLTEYSVDPRVHQDKALLDLSGYKFGIVRGYVNTQAFDRANYLFKEDVVDDFTNLKRLYFDRIQFIFIDKFVAEHILNKQLPSYKDELVFMDPPLEVKNLYLAFSRNAPDYDAKLQAFNQGLDMIKADGTLQKIYEKHGFKEILKYQKQTESLTK